MRYLFFLCVLVLTCGCGLRWADEESRCAPIVAAPKAKPIVMIDPGHGGEDRGAHSDKAPRYEEKRLTLQTAKMVSHYLTKMGYPNRLTRQTDVFVGLKERARMADRAQVPLFVSVHYNTAPAKEAHGIEVFYFESKSDPLRSAQSKELGGDVLEALLQATSAKSRGVKKGNLAVLRETHMPAILVEAGFLTNQREREKIHTEHYRHNIARGIAKGIDRYYKKKCAPGAS